MRILTLSLLALLLSARLAAADTDWPAVTAETKPWSRWWWLGNTGTKADYTVQMERYAKAGLGGLEITPIYGVRGEEAQFRPYLSPAWMELFDHVLDEGKRLGLGLDMSTGTGWPFGGPWVAPEIAARRVVTKTYQVKGGEQLAEAVRVTDQPLVRVAGPRRVTIGELQDPVTANANLQDLALDQVRFPRSAVLQTLIARSDSGEKLDLTAKVGPDGRLDWTAPAGTWTLYALFLGWHGKQVERAGPGGEGDVIDHFSSSALAAYLRKFDQAYVGHRPNRLRAYFNDSYEVDDASGESNWTARFLEEFQRRRGYDLRDELPAFFGQDTADRNARVMADHRETISDLLLDEFTRPWASWAKSHGALIRNQAHGSPANIIDLYAASDIPETEGTNIIGMKLASSAAHVTGRRLTSAETATWLDEHWVSTLGDVKRRVDLMFLGGVNHNCYHGTVFSPPGAAWPGHHFYAAVELDPSNPLWADFDVLNAYVTRAQSFLQGGGPANDVLLYYSIHDQWMQRGNGAMPHFSGGARPGGMGLAQELHDRGYGFDFITDRLLQKVSVKDGAVEAGGNRYRVIVVPEVKYLPASTLAQLFRLAEDGATIVFHRQLPGDVPGLGRLAAERAEFKRQLAAFTGASVESEGARRAAWKRGQIVLGDDWQQLLARAGVRRETLVDQGLQFERRRFADGHAYFLLNRGENAYTGWVPLAVAAVGACVFDPMSGRSGVAATRATAAGGLEVFLQLAPAESCVVRTLERRAPAGPKYDQLIAVGPDGAGAIALGAWSVTFTTGGPVLPAATAVPELQSWTTFGGEAAAAFGGTASYRNRFKTDARGDLVLDLGKVADSARVRVNGREVAAVIMPPWRAVIPRAALKSGDNELEILVTNLAANRIADLDRRDPSWKKFYNTNYPARIGSNRGPDGNFSAAKWPVRPAGLLGPVQLVPAVALAPRP